MTEQSKERICKTCAWFIIPNDLYPELGECQLEPRTEPKTINQRCRHHAFTTGWLEEEKRPLIQWAPGMPPEHHNFEPKTPDELELWNLTEATWQKYLVLCRDWQLMKGKKDETEPKNFESLP